MSVKAKPIKKILEICQELKLLEREGEEREGSMDFGVKLKGVLVVNVVICIWKGVILHLWNT